jgi:hypothetical protein
MSKSTRRLALIVGFALLAALAISNSVRSQNAEEVGAEARESRADWYADLLKRIQNAVQTVNSPEYRDQLQEKYTAVSAAATEVALPVPTLRPGEEPLLPRLEEVSGTQLSGLLDVGYAPYGDMYIHNVWNGEVNGQRFQILAGCTLDRNEGLVKAVPPNLGKRVPVALPAGTPCLAIESEKNGKIFLITEAENTRLILDIASLTLVANESEAKPTITPAAIEHSAPIQYPPQPTVNPYP